ncbi:MAG: phosphopeptide-binding protein, partial [Clostridiales bacterium]|nr:phosphopeptide-binding protein [Clostridiales bacterium]
RGLKLCPNCRTENNLEYGFCYKCGAKFDEATASAPAAPVEAPAEAPAAEEPAAPAEEAKTEE